MKKWVIGVLVLVFLLRIPSFFEPYNYGDEMIYLTLGQGVRQGVPLYTGIHDNKPPLLYLTAAVAGNLFWFKFALMAFSFVSIVFFYKITKTLFEKNLKLQKMATGIFAIFTTIPLLEGNIANAENFMMATTLVGFYILLSKAKTFKNLFFAGILFGISTLYKVPAAFEMPVILTFWLVTSDFTFKSFKEIVKNSFIVIVGFLLPILLSFGWFHFQGGLGDYIRAAFLQNVGYVSSFRPGDVQKPFLIKNAPLLIRALIVLMGLGIISAFRNKLSKPFLLTIVWLLFALFAVALSERPYPHYLLQAVAPIAILFGILFAQKTYEQSLTVIPLALAFFVPYYFHFWIYPVTPYYIRFVNFAARGMSKDEYINSFNSKTRRNYQIAQFLSQSSRQTDRVFMWDSDSPVVYALARRLPPIKYVVPYHVNDYSNRTNVIKDLHKNPPKFIILTTENNFPELYPLLGQRYLLIQSVENAEIWSRMR